MIEIAYALYLIISIGITIWVAHTLHSNGEVFLIQCFGHNAAVAKSTNHLLVVGFYLVNIGVITLTLSLGNEPSTYPEAIRFLSSKVGLAVLVLGGLHFFNMTAIARFGRKVNDWLTDRRMEESVAA
jgi:hypothetical protein